MTLFGESVSVPAAAAEPELLELLELELLEPEPEADDGAAFNLSSSIFLISPILRASSPSAALDSVINATSRN